jgi:hypothetical protein
MQSVSSFHLNGTFRNFQKFKHKCQVQHQKVKSDLQHCKAPELDAGSYVLQTNVVQA